jgi:hypothetical protein
MAVHRNYGVWASPLPWTFVVAIFVTAPLVYVASKPNRIVEVSIQPEDDTAARVLSRGVVARSYGGPVFFDFRAEVRDPSIEHAALLIRPEAIKEFYMQDEPNGYPVDNGIARGTAQLGSAEFPLQHDAQYSFRLVRMSSGVLPPPGTGVLAEGIIFARVTEIAGPDRLMIGVIGVLASVIQILYAFVTALQTERSERRPLPTA